MADYEELVARLRSQARLERHYHTTGKTSDEAADAIEELQAMLISSSGSAWRNRRTTTETFLSATDAQISKRLASGIMSRA